MNSALLLSACKFIDFAVILLPRYFHLYQWCFVRGKGDVHTHPRSSVVPNFDDVPKLNGLEISARDKSREFGAASGKETPDTHRSSSPVPTLGLPQNQPHLQGDEPEPSVPPNANELAFHRQGSLSPAVHDFEPHLVALSKRIQRTHGRFSSRGRSSHALAAAHLSVASSSKSPLDRPASAPPRSRSPSPEPGSGSGSRSSRTNGKSRLSTRDVKTTHKRKHRRSTSKSKSKSKSRGVVGLGTGLSPSGLRRPMLLMRTISADDFWVLSEFHDRVSRLVFKYSTSENSAADLEFVDKLLLSDFIESDQFANPLC